MAENSGFLRRKKPVKKLDISYPLGDLQHIRHIGPEEYALGAEFDMTTSELGTHAPPPCSGKVKDGSVDSTRSMSSDQVPSIDPSLFQTLKKEIEELVTYATGLMNKAEGIESQFQKIITHDQSLPSVQEKNVTRSRADTFDDIPEDVFIGEANQAESSLYENTVEGVAVRDKQNSQVTSTLNENSAGTLKANVSQSDIKGATTLSGELNIVSKPCANKSGIVSETPPATDTLNLKNSDSVLDTKSSYYSKDKFNDTEDARSGDDQHCNEDDSDVDTAEGTSEEARIDNSICNPMYPTTTYNVKKIQKTDRYEMAERSKAMHSAGPFIKKPPANLYAKAEDRECLSEALRVHVVDIVDNVVFRESELPDELTADSCITEDECETIRQIRNRRDQVRALLSAIRGKDYTVLVRFVEKIKVTNRQIAENIIESFEEYRKQYHRSLHCAKCKMMERVNVKYICDGLLATHAICDSLYNEIIYDTKPTGGQKVLWNHVLDSINKLDTRHRKLTYDFIREELSKKHYKYVSDHLRKAVANDKELHCQCTIHPSPRGSDPVDYFSPRSSSEVSRDSSNTEIKEIVSDQEQAVKSPEREKKRHGVRNILLLNDEAILETISEQSEKSSGVKVSKPKALPRTTLTKKSQMKEIYEDFSFA